MAKKHTVLKVVAVTAVAAAAVGVAASVLRNRREAANKDDDFDEFDDLDDFDEFDEKKDSAGNDATVASASDDFAEWDSSGQAAAAGTQEKIDEIREKLENDELYVFDTSTFTVDGKNLDSYKADVDTDAKYEHETEVISDRYFHESVYRSAPYFDLRIDGITLLDERY